MTLHSIGRRLKTVGGAPLKINNQPLQVDFNTTNLCPPFDEWRLVGGAHIDDEGSLVFTSTSGTFAEVFIFINQAARWTFSSQVYCDYPSPNVNNHPHASRLYNSAYFGADRVTSVMNSDNYAANGNAGRFLTGQWSPRYSQAAPLTNGSWGSPGGAGVFWVRMRLEASAAYVSIPTKYRLPMMTAGPAYVQPPFTHYYKKGLSQ